MVSLNERYLFERQGLDGVYTKVDLTEMELEAVAWILSGSGWEQSQVIVNKVINRQVGTFKFLIAALLKI